jgi:tripartite ATP-independent transporter DctP family solute receptor
VSILSWPANAAEFSYKYANNSPVTHPLNIRTSEAAARVKEKTSGKVEIQVFPNNQLGSDTDMLSQLRSGALEFFTLSGLILSTLVPVASINGVGFAFKDYSQVWPTMDGALGTLVRGEIAKRGLYAFSKMYDNGYRQITSASKPVKTPEDLSGFKIRVPASPLWTSMFKAFGASPTTINFNEVYTALQTHVVDGQENPLSLIDTAKLYEVQKFVAITNHMWDGFWFLANKKSFEAMPANLREIVEAEFNASAIAEREDLAKMNNGVADTLKGKGLQFVETDAAAFRGALKKAGFYEEWKGKFGAEAWGVLEKAVGNLS